MVISHPVGEMSSDFQAVFLNLPDKWQNLKIDCSCIFSRSSFTGMLTLYTIDLTPEVCSVFHYRIHFF
jgi:hypothetical protein